MSILTITLAYIIGIKWGLYQDLMGLILVLIFLSIFTLIFLKRKINLLIICCVICLIGCIYTKIKFISMENKYTNGDIKDEIIILSHEEVSSDKYYYKYKAKNKKGDKFIVYLNLREENIYEIGTSLKIFGTLKIPEESRNKGGFNYKLYLYSNGIYGTIKVKHAEVILKNENNIIYYFQNKIRNNMLKIFERDIAGILNGMLIGETNDISNEIKETFQEIGITHLLAVSRCKCNACY